MSDFLNELPTDDPADDFIDETIPEAEEEEPEEVMEETVSEEVEPEETATAEVAEAAEAPVEDDPEESPAEIGTFEELPIEHYTDEKGNPKVVPEPPPKKNPRILVTSQSLTVEQARSWDRLMSEVSSQTRDAIWEQNITTIEQLLRGCKNDFVRPRGKLTEQQFEEVNNWFREELGYFIPDTATKPPARSTTPVPVRSVKSGGLSHDRRVARAERFKNMKSGR